MERIASFCVDHTRLERGMYISRVDGDVVTYDIRMKKPNQGDYLANGALHTIEHLFATYARNSVYGPGVIYVGPMGCRTGFYLLTRGLTPAELDSIPEARKSYPEFSQFRELPAWGLHPPREEHHDGQRTADRTETRLPPGDRARRRTRRRPGERNDQRSG